MKEKAIQRFKSVFQQEKTVIGMIHLKALPGTPAFEGDVDRIISAAVGEAETYQKARVDALLLENMHDTPYLNRSVGPEITALMAVIAYQIKQRSGMPVGIQVLAGSNRESLAIAKAAGLDFIRAEGFLFSHVADEGMMNADAGDLLRYRRTIDAENILVLTDIKKKHGAHALTADVDLPETAKAAEFFRSDGVILTGKATGLAADPEELKKVREIVELPLLVGSGIGIENVDVFLPLCDAMIIGSAFKLDGKWQNPLDFDSIKFFMERVRNIRGSS